MSEQSSSNYPTSIPLHVSSIDSRSGAQNGKKKSSGGKKGSSKKKTVDCPIFLQSKFHSPVFPLSFMQILYSMGFIVESIQYRSWTYGDCP